LFALFSIPFGRFALFFRLLDLTRAAPFLLLIFPLRSFRCCLCSRCAGIYVETIKTRFVYLMWEQHIPVSLSVPPCVSLFSALLEGSWYA